MCLMLGATVPNMSPRGALNIEYASRKYLGVLWGNRILKIYGPTDHGNNNSRGVNVPSVYGTT